TLGRKPSGSITAYNLADACAPHCSTKWSEAESRYSSALQRRSSEAARPSSGCPKRRFRLCCTLFLPEDPCVRLALFDLDNTLLAGDSDHAWGEFLCQRGLVDVETYRARNDAFYQDYLAGRLDVLAYQNFCQELLGR